MTNPSLADWLPISTAPRDGTTVELTDSPDGEVWPMRYEVFKPTRDGQPVASEKGTGRVGGVWAMWGFSGSLLSTWSEEDPDCPPRLWRPVKVAEVRRAA